MNPNDYINPSVLLWEREFEMGGGVWNGSGCLPWEGVFGIGGGVWEKIPLLWLKIVEFEKIVVIEYIMSGVIPLNQYFDLFCLKLDPSHFKSLQVKGLTNDF